ncbi:MAG: alpha-amylase family glycosyl hydrolase, partial [Steroidobacteraceae bacterium]
TRPPLVLSTPIKERTSLQGMTTARKTQISLQDTPYYHVVARCVRRAWLWGVDEYAGKDYSHRKRWVLERLAGLSKAFAIDVCAYAVMSNHYHLVLRVAHERSAGWSDREVIYRWTQLFSRPSLVDRWVKGECGAAECEAVMHLIKRWRQRLSDVSWYMRCLNEHLARRANQEDDCRGRFWEGRFKSQALLDEAGLLTAMVYVDLNPLRAGVVATPEDAEFTSIYQRIRALRKVDLAARAEPCVPLLAFSLPGGDAAGIPFTMTDYLALADWTGRARMPGKRGVIVEAMPAIAQRLNIDPQAWLGAMQPGGNVFGRALGQLDHLRLHAKSLGQRWVRGLRQAQRMYG